MATARKKLKVCPFKINRYAAIALLIMSLGEQEQLFSTMLLLF